jgi:hypothetical protein
MHFKTAFWMTTATLCLLAAPFMTDYHVRLFARLEGFSRRESFSLLDSLPALSAGLGDLEAFKLTADPGSKTNVDRSVWLADSLGQISMEFYSGKSVFDSALLYLWTSDSVAASRTLKGGRSIAWNIPVRKKIDAWTEVVGVYVSRPRFLNFKAPDPSITLFDQVEGKTIHIVRKRYRDRVASPVLPDTLYPASASGELSGDLQLMAKGDALAIVNPSAGAIELRVIRISEKRWEVCEVKAHSIQIYRSLLRDVRGPILAYTSPGRTHPLLFKAGEIPAAYFWLERPALH